jgi:hypothetical protein
VDQKHAKALQCNTCSVGLHTLFKYFHKLFKFYSNESFFPKEIAQFLPIFTFITECIVEKGFVFSVEVRNQLGNSVSKGAKDKLIKASVNHLSIIGVKIDQINHEGKPCNLINASSFNLELFSFFDKKSFQYDKKIKEQEKEINELKNLTENYKKELDKFNDTTAQHDKFLKGFIRSSRKYIHDDGGEIRKEQKKTSCFDQCDFSLPVNDITKFFVESLRPKNLDPDSDWFKRLQNGEDIVAISKIHKLFIC